ncbi:MAG: LTA synthase family protein, partial [Bacteroidales bacterium]|nr:LTA synthase family protein [Bacteroidales bacterium]
IAFGNSYFDDSDTTGYVINFSEPLYLISKGKYFLQFDGTKETGFYIPDEDVMLQNNLIGRFPDEESAMLKLLKAEIQQYHVRMIGNDLTVAQ